MKREEAIEWLEVMKENEIFERYDALKMAIEALQITETPIDLVNRGDVVGEFIKLFGCIQDVSDIDEWADICQTTIREVPSAKTPNNTQTIDLISRADAKQQISEWATIITNPTLVDKDATMVVLDSLPSAEAEPIVIRCKDCKNRAKHVVCHFLGEDGFCPYGERKGGEDE